MNAIFVGRYQMHELLEQGTQVLASAQIMSTGRVKLTFRRDIPLNQQWKFVPTEKNVSVVFEQDQTDLKVKYIETRKVGVPTEANYTAIAIE